MPARHSPTCRLLALLAVVFAAGIVGTLAAAVVSRGHRALILYTTVTIICTAACGLCVVGWMLRKWLLPLSVTWNLAAKEAQRHAHSVAVENGKHLAVVRVPRERERERESR